MSLTRPGGGAVSRTAVAKQGDTGKTRTDGFLLFTGTVFSWLRLCPRLCCLFFGRFCCLEAVRMRGVSRSKDSTELGACCRLPSRGIPRIQKEYLVAVHDPPTRASQVTRSCQCRFMPSATWSTRGQGRLWRTLPREAALPQIGSCPCARGRGWTGNVMTTPTAPSSPPALRLPLANRKRPKRKEDEGSWRPRREEVHFV